MKDTKLSVKKWLEKFNNGDFEKSNLKTQVEAGWYDWFCFNKELPNRLKKIGKFLKQIKNSQKITDDLYVCLKNCSPLNGKLYDCLNLYPRYTIAFDYKTPAIIYDLRVSASNPIFKGTKQEAIKWFMEEK